MFRNVLDIIKIGVYGLLAHYMRITGSQRDQLCRPLFQMLAQVVGGIKSPGSAGVAIAQQDLQVAPPVNLFYPRDIVAHCKHLAGPEMPESMERPDR